MDNAWGAFETTDIHKVWHLSCGLHYKLWTCPAREELCAKSQCLSQHLLYMQINRHDPRSKASQLYDNVK
jgi:hypothetical protein